LVDGFDHNISQGIVLCVCDTYPQRLEAGLDDHVALEGLEAQDALGDFGDGLLGQERQALSHPK